MRRSDQRRDAVFANYQRDVTGRSLEELLGEARPLTRELAEGVDVHREELDDVIAAHAKGWTVDRIAPLDMNVMRVALYEMDFMDTPAEVAIDEAVEIAKEYCGADAPGFIVNRLLFRVLGAVLASLDAGADPAEVDASLDPLGLPMRPFTLLDLVGLKVADHVGEVLRGELGERFHASPGLHEMAERGGRFTDRVKGAVHAPVSAAVGEVFGAGGASGSAPVGDALLEAVQDGLAEEIGLMLDEHVVERPDQIDLGMILGAGFPRHRGGITPYLDQVGASERAAGRRFHGDRFARS